MESVNPAIPTSIGALLAEEWTIDPYSVLLSFVEMVMMQDAARSTHKALGFTVETMERRLQQTLAVSHQPEEDSNGSTERDTNTTSHWYRTMSSWIRQCRHASIAAAHHLLARYGPELQFLVTYLVERKCILANSATVAETIYGAKRVKLLKDGTLRPLTKADQTRVALLVALLPYLRHRGDRLFRQWNSQQQDSNSSISCWRHRFVALYPWLRTSLALGTVACQWRFLLGRSVHFDGISILLGHVVRRVTQQDQQEGADVSEVSDNEPVSTEDPNKDSLSPVAATTATNSLGHKVALYLLTSSLVLSWATQLRSEWQRYRQERQLRNATNSSNALLPPPPPPPPSTSTRSNNTTTGLCPLCQRPHVQPTASTSGHVFCLSCLLPFVKEHGRCPVTGVDCPESRIVRLYEPRAQDWTPPTERTNTSSAQE